MTAYAIKMIKVECDGTVQEFPAQITAGKVIKEVYGKKTGAVAALVNNEEKDLSYLLSKNCTIEPIKDDSEEGLYIMRHSCAHLLAQAVTELFPEAKPTNEEDLRKIEKLMKKIVKQNIPIEREEHKNETLRKMFSNNSFKMEIMDDKIGDEVGSSAYRQGKFVDLCRGPHVESTAKLRWFKLTNTSQAFWRADSSRQTLVRIYGMCYSSKEELQARETMMREAAMIFYLLFTIC